MGTKSRKPRVRGTARPSALLAAAPTGLVTQGQKQVSLEQPRSGVQSSVPSPCCWLCSSRHLPIPFLPHPYSASVSPPFPVSHLCPEHSSSVEPTCPFLMVPSTDALVIVSPLALPSDRCRHLQPKGSLFTQAEAWSWRGQAVRGGGSRPTPCKDLGCQGSRKPGQGLGRDPFTRPAAPHPG